MALRLLLFLLFLLFLSPTASSLSATAVPSECIV
jgi:hypothetical protein